ncbi:MAG: penicillin-binding transpeptidase domain-containing protein [Candidatus Nomurabacteria bacterium]
MVKNYFKRILRKINKKKGKEIDPEDIFLDSSNLAGLDMDRMEGSIDRPISKSAEIVPFIFLIFIFILFTARLFNLEVLNFDTYKEKADNNRYNTDLILANRGEIFDRNGKVLASNISASSSYIFKREYISDPGFSNLLGYISYPKADNLKNYWQDDYIGKDGVELIYQKLLTGINGKKIAEKDVKASVESENIIVKPVSGANLNLSIDAELQKSLFNSIRDVVNTREYVSGTGIIMDVTNGEILAITTFPQYDNNLMTNATGTLDNQKIVASLKDKRTPFLNRPVKGLFTPGSVVKPFMAYAALNEKVISPEKNILSTGKIVIKNRYGGADTVFKDWKAHGYINVVRAIAESSDEYFYQVGGGYADQTGLGIARIDTYARLFGFASTTNIDLPGEVVGVIPTPDWKRINFVDGDWFLGDTYHTSIGQYGFQVTPVELIRYVACLANGGKMVTPHVFLSASSSDPFAEADVLNEYNNKVWPMTDLNLNQSALKYVKEGMREVVMPGGTEPMLEIPSLKIAAKSGTAEIGVVKGRVNSLITGYFPYDNPKYAFTVIMENGKIGNSSGAVQAVQPVLNYIAAHKEQYIK